jgi:hypothetical protein
MVSEETIVIARTWRGWVSTEKTAAYVEYVTRTGLDSYRKTPGNLGAQMWTRDLGDGRTEVMTMTTITSSTARPPSRITTSRNLR